MGIGEYDDGIYKKYVVTGYSLVAIDPDVSNRLKLRTSYDLWAESGTITLTSITGGVEIVYTGEVNLDTHNPQYATSEYDGNNMVTTISKWDEFVSGYLPSGILNYANSAVLSELGSDEDLRCLIRRHVGKVYMHYGVNNISHMRGIWNTSSLVSG